MEPISLYPLKFEPIYQYRVWGGRRLSDLLTEPLPPDEPIGEAWILSDRDDHPSKITNGQLKGQTISQLFEHSKEALLGRYAPYLNRFPLLLKFLDGQQVLSVQVHPSDQLTPYIPDGESGKTEAWVVLETGPDARIYAGLKPGTTKILLRQSISQHKVATNLASFKPNIGDGVFIKAGTVHTLADAVVFEIQQNSDVTYRLYDWDRIDEKTGKPRDLQVEEAMACIDFAQTDIKPLIPEVLDEGYELKEKLFDNEHFVLWRITGTKPFMAGQEATPRILVCIAGEGELESKADLYTLRKGEVMLIPAICGACPFVPKGTVVLLEIALPVNFNF